MKKTVHPALDHLHATLIMSPVNQIQKYLSVSMLLILLGFLIYPQWMITWTQRLDYRYYYDADLPQSAQGTPPDDVWQSGFELEKHHESRRHWIFPPPHPHMEPLPAPKAEFTGTGSVNLGKRHTTYTNASVLNLSATVNKRNSLWEITIMLIPLGMFLIMFRDKPRRITPPTVPIPAPRVPSLSNIPPASSTPTAEPSQSQSQPATSPRVHDASKC